MPTIPPISSPFLERKHKPGGAVSEYTCTCAHYEPGFAIIRFVHGRPYAGPVAIPAGSVSYGFFWADRAYNVYRVTDPAGDALAHRFDALHNVRITANAVDYHDLVLDWWLLPDGTLIEEDRPEFDSLLAAGLLAPEQVATAVATGDLLQRDAAAIAADCAALKARFVPT